jgi:hypothetical protein
VTTALQRTVLVLGPRAEEPVQLYPDDIAGSMSLVVVVVGWPLTAAQQEAVESCRRLAHRARIVFDAMLVGSFDAGIAEISARDRVLLGTGRRETRRVQRTLGARKINARVAR